MSKLTLYTAPTPNGHPISILLEELIASGAFPKDGYEVIRMTFFDPKDPNHVKLPWFVEINPNGRIPAIKMDDGFTVFETSAILLYLAQEFDTARVVSFDPVKEAKAYSEMLQWIFFAHGGIGPMQGQAVFFLRATEKLPYAIDRYKNETRRLYSILETQLASKQFLCGDKYTLADIKAYPWVRRSDLLEIDLEKDFPNVKAWCSRIEARPAVQEGLKIPAN